MRKYSLDRMSVFALKNGLYTGEVWPEEETGEALSRVRRLLPRVMEGMLTPRQRQYVTLYFFEQKKIPAIAKELKVNKSSVQRGLAAARRNLEKALAGWL